jgi:hypothetical protein
MHPLLKSRNGILIYIAICIPISAMISFVLGLYAHVPFRESVHFTIPLTILLGVACLTPWYTCRGLPLKSTRPWKLLLGNLIVAMCASAAVFSLVRLTVEGLSRFFPDLLDRIPPAGPVLAGMVFMCLLLSIALHYVMFAVESSKQAEVLSREAELKALKAQVNPHFLFNSLNSISALTTVDPKLAREMCIRLSDFLRTSLRLGERASIPFGEELSLASSYLDVEKIRFGKRLRVTQNFDPACSECEVPPLLVQPLIENAIKHGIAGLSEGGEILMAARIANDRLFFAIENPFDPDAPVMRKSGFGLVNVRNRLTARYGGLAKLDVHADNNTYKVVITLPFQANGKGPGI